MNLYAFIADALRCDVSSLNQESGFGTHPQWDSLGHLQILAALEDHLGIDIDVYSVERFATLEEIARLPQFREDGESPGA